MASQALLHFLAAATSNLALSPLSKMTLGCSVHCADQLAVLQYNHSSHPVEVATAVTTSKRLSRDQGQGLLPTPGSPKLLDRLAPIALWGRAVQCLMSALILMYFSVRATIFSLCHTT